MQAATHADSRRLAGTHLGSETAQEEQTMTNHTDRWTIHSRRLTRAERQAVGVLRRHGARRQGAGRPAGPAARAAVARRRRQAGRDPARSGAGTASARHAVAGTGVPARAVPQGGVAESVARCGPVPRRAASRRRLPMTHRHTTYCCNDCGGHPSGNGCDGCDRRRRNEARAKARRERDDVLRDLGLTRVRGALGGTYWE
jgi:hypothetical protein